MSEVVARLFVPGRPRTKGSLKPMHIPGKNGRGCTVGLTEDHALSTPWKNEMIKVIRCELGIKGAYRMEQRGKKRVKVFVRTDAAPYPEPVEVHAFFRFERDLSVAMGTRGHVVPSHSTPWPTDDGIGDEDKLRRNVLDALTQSGLILDDRMVIGGGNWKRWVEPGERSGVAILVRSAPLPEHVRELERQALAL